MEFNSGFFKTISTIADFLTIGTVISAIPFALLKKNELLLAFRISKFLHYLLKTAVAILVTLGVILISKLVYFIILLPLAGNINDANFSWESGKEVEHIIAYFISTTVGLSLLWILLTFIWTSSWNSTKEFLNLFLPKRKLLTKQQSPLEILSAVYKTNNAQVDVTPIARQMISNNSLTIKASNDLAGDPELGIVKALVINYRVGQNSSQVQINEGDTITIPQT